MDVEENYESQSATETPSQQQGQQQQGQQEQQQQQRQQGQQEQQQQQRQQQQLQQQEQQQQLQQQLQQLQDMQCEPLFGITTNTTTTTNPMMDTSNIAIPLPAPPGTGLVVSTATTPLPLPTPAQAAQIKGLGVPVTLPTNDYDIDSLLLQQFSCMGTTDHEDLISQFQSLMNNQMNRESARFYLEMSNWNLQTAVGCYLDFCSLQSLPSMKIVQGQHVNAQQQAFQLQNDGNERWPNGCYLTSPIQTQRINVPSLRPGETCDILADLIPTQPAIMWRLCTPNGWYFGDAIWMIPPGTQASQDELQQRMVQLITSEAKPEVYPQIKIVITAHTQ
ncbi:transcription factor SPT20 homolog isoform X1 [Drosophila innubila]|uniref:transcription factor SPT20 homolog isoform X1 n=1 Tax=Drosophila innubila TaxID=198719 RepID=UPI00148CA3AD|nr:transcription factor SPT20 homolog isoform X1 [Drosophila innubila]